MSTAEHEQQPDQTTIWAMIQSQKSAAIDSSPTFVHPLVRRSSSLMSNSSLEMCTESLGSETGAGDFSDDDRGWLNSSSDDDQAVVKTRQHNRQRQPKFGKQLTTVNYHCSASRKSVPRSFPPPLPSISCRDGTRIQMTTCRQGGRLVVKAVAVASQNYLDACRHDGRLLLSFVNANTAVNQTPSDTSAEDNNEFAAQTIQELEHLKQEEKLVEQIAAPLAPAKENNQYPGEAEDEEDEEEVEVVDRGAIASTTITAAAAAVAASSATASTEMVGRHPAENKLLFRSKRRYREEMLHHMQRFSELGRPLFFREAGCIATSS